MRDIMDDPPDVVTLISGLRSENESARKYAVFKLQGLLSDPSFADAFVQGDGVVSLRDAVMQTTGNTQAYALGSLDKLLELDMGWEGVDILVIEKVCNVSSDPYTYAHYVWI
jgi:engulfment/cell motility protein 1